jgi:2-phospho-L-lactate guanylyltransferase
VLQPAPNAPRPAGDDTAVLVPIKAFGIAKNRLAGALDPEARARLARDLAAGVLQAAAPLPVYVVCEDDDVATWAAAAGAQPLRSNGGGLNAAVEHGVAALAAEGFAHVCVVHADLPAARDLARVTGHPGATLVPDRHGDGTNVLCVPARAGFRFAYGPGSFARHVAEARRVGLPVRVLHIAELAWDVDTAADLGHLPTGTGAAAAGSSTTSPGPAGRYPAPGPIGRPAAMDLDLPIPRSALAIAAHPDDVEFQCGATFAKWAAHGCVLHLLICTDGSKGSWDVQADTAELVAVRRREQRAAADALGSRGEVRYLGAVDGELEQTRAHVAAIARIIRELRPEVVLTHDPWRRWRLHPDHRNAGFLGCDAVVAARDPHFFPEHGVAHHRPDAMLLFETEEPDHVEDVTGHEAAKVAALLAHVSQFETTMKIDPPDDPVGRASFDARIRDELAVTGRLVGVRSAEGFRRLRDL